MQLHQSTALSWVIGVLAVAMPIAVSVGLYMAADSWTDSAPGIAAVVTAALTFGAAFFAWQTARDARVAARESAQTARDAGDALAGHYRPVGTLQFTGPDGSLEVPAPGLPAQAVVQLERTYAHHTDTAISWVTKDGVEKGPRQLELDPAQPPDTAYDVYLPVELAGCTLVGDVVVGREVVDLLRLTVTTRDTVTRRTWTATAQTPSWATLPRLGPFELADRT